MARLHGEALTLVAEVAANLNARKSLNKSCESAAARLRVLIDEANAIATGETLQERTDPDNVGDVGGQAAIDALFGTR